MSLSAPKIFLITAVVAFSFIGVFSAVKKKKNSNSPKQEAPTAKPSQNKPQLSTLKIAAASTERPNKQNFSDFPNIDRLYQLFTVGQNKLPIVETISYSSTVPWLKGRPAWISDYAAYYSTSRHFIARSLHGKPDYFNQTVASGRKFNVFKKDKKIQFHLLIDISQLKMGLFYLDLDSKERVLLKTYHVGLGRLDSQKESGSLTPVGTYLLGDKTAIYTPGITGLFQDQKTEMMRVFGTRWIPFGQALDGSSEPAKGYGIQGAPWVVDSQSGKLIENRECIGKYESDGCIRLALEDMEELFAIVITKPTYVHLVKDFKLASLPGTEVATPSR
jgi:hypothetical protein